MFFNITPSSLLEPTSPNADPAWMMTPDVRSTFDLVSSCFLTLLLCTWTAVHLNIPTHKERMERSQWPWIWRRARWMALAVFAPEFVLESAWMQYTQARLLCARLKNIEETRLIQNTPVNMLNDPEEVNGGVPLSDRAKKTNHHNRNEPGLGNRQNTEPSFWKRIVNFAYPEGLERGFYAYMGGFEIEIEPSPELRSTCKTKRYQLTPCGAVLLAKLDRLPAIEVDLIKDKSKADSMTKLLVCIQGSWMLIQAVGRKIVGLPITLLELNTIMHVVCAFVMYLIWFRKPQDVGVPSAIKDEHPNKPLGVMLSIIEAHLSSYREPFGIGMVRSGCVSVLYNRQPEGAFEYIVLKEGSEPHTQTIWESENSTDPIPVDNFVICDSGKVCLNLTLRPQSSLTMQSAQFLVDYTLGKISTFGETKINWTTFCETIQQDGGFIGYTEEVKMNDEAGQLSIDVLKEWKWFLFTTVSAFILITMYGGVHLTAWSSHFPTHIERYLWRASAIYSIVGGCLMLLQNYYGLSLGGWLKNKINPPSNSVLYRLLRGLTKSIHIIWVGLYVLARVYLVIEALVSLRSPPAGAYMTVPWTELWVHF